MRGLQLLALMILLSARANARAHSPPSEHKHLQDHPDTQHVKHLVIDHHPLNRTYQEHYFLDHDRSGDSHLGEYNQSSEDQNDPSRDSNFGLDRRYSAAAVTSIPEDTKHHVRSSEDLNYPFNHHHRPPQVKPNSPSKVILQYVNHIEDLRNPSHHHKHHTHAHNHTSENSNYAKTDRDPLEVVNLTSEDVEPSKDNNPYTSHTEEVNSPYHHHHKSVDLTYPVKGHSNLQDLHVTLEDVNRSEDYEHSINHSSFENVNLTSEDQILKLEAPTQAKAGKDYSQGIILTLDDHNATHEDENLTYEDDSYKDRSVSSVDERSTYEEQNSISGDKSASYEEGNLTSEDERATYEERNLTSEDERSTYEERNLSSDDERSINQERNLTSEDKRSTYEERNINSDDERSTNEERNLTFEDVQATYEERNVRSGDKRISENYHSHGNHPREDNHNQKSPHAKSSHHQAPKKTKHPKHFYSSSRVYPKFARQLSQILRPFFHIQETSDEHPFDLTRQRLIHNGNKVEIFPLHPTPVNQDSKAPLALILGGPKRDKGRKKYFYSKKHKHGHVKASIEILDDESDEKPENYTVKNKTDKNGIAVTSEIGNDNREGVNFDNEDVSRIVELNNDVENNPVVAPFNDIQSHTVLGSGYDKGALQVGNNDYESQIDDGFIYASTETVLESNDSDLLTVESNSNRYSSLDSSISDYSDSLSSSSSNSFDLSNVSVFPSVYTLSLENEGNVKKEMDRSSFTGREENYTGTEARDEHDSYSLENEGTDVSVIDENFYLTPVSDRGNDDIGIKEQFDKFASGNNGENINNVLDHLDDIASENELSGDYSIRDSIKSEEYDTKLHEQYTYEEILNEELTREDNENQALVDEIINRKNAEELAAEDTENYALVDQHLNRNSVIITNELGNVVSDIPEHITKEIELKLDNNDDKCRKYVLQFRLPDTKSDNTRVLEELKNLLETHQRTQKSYNLSFLFQK